MDVHTESLHSLLLLEDTLDREVESLEEELIWHQRKLVYLQALGCPEDQLEGLNLTIRKSDGMLATLKQLLQQTYLERKMCSENLQTSVQSRPLPTLKSSPPHHHPNCSPDRGVHGLRHRNCHRRYTSRLNSRRQEKSKSLCVATRLTNLPPTPPRELSDSIKAHCSSEGKSSKTFGAKTPLPTVVAGENPVAFCGSLLTKSNKSGLPYHTNCLIPPKEDSTLSKSPEEKCQRRILSNPSVTDGALHCGCQRSHPKILDDSGVLQGKQMFHPCGRSTWQHCKTPAGPRLSLNLLCSDRPSSDDSVCTATAAEVSNVTTPVSDSVLDTWHVPVDVEEFQVSQNRPTNRVDSRNPTEEIATFEPYGCYSGCHGNAMMFSSAYTDLRQG